jgi:transposase
MVSILCVSNVLLLQKLRQANQQIQHQLQTLTYGMQETIDLTKEMKRQQLMLLNQAQRLHKQLNDLDQSVKLSQQQSQLS